MKHYCRYCTRCTGFEEDLGWCDAIKKEVKKTSVRNACTDFEFCEIDAFYYNRTDNPDDAKYKPREHKSRDGGQIEGQMKFEFE